MLLWDALLNAMVTGLFVGVGSTFGAWLVNKHFISRLERLEERIGKREGKGE
jgi:hypothetical protein